MSASSGTCRPAERGGTLLAESQDRRAGAPRQKTLKAKPGLAVLCSKARCPTRGEVVTSSDEPFAFASGYVGLPEKTVEAWRDLWFHVRRR
jgi:hypothetical protein